MTDADFVAAAVRSFDSMDVACCSFVKADEAKDRKVEIVRARSRDVQHSISQFKVFVNPRLAALASRHLGTDAQEWLGRLLELIQRVKFEEYGLFLERLRSQRAAFLSLNERVAANVPNGKSTGRVHAVGQAAR